MKVSKSLIIIGIIAVVVLFFGGYIVGTMNTMNKMKVTIDEKQGEIQNMLQNRCDMVNQLVAETKGSVIAESKYMKDVIEARNGLSTTLGANNMEQIAEANSKLNIAINALREAYPDFKSSTTFIRLMDETAGAQNRVTVAQTYYNEQVGSYNRYIISFPASIIASMTGNTAKEFFKASVAAQEAPTIDFSDLK